jgi:hypothetical protein
VRKLVLAELDRLKVRSDLLNKEIEFLAQPVTKVNHRRARSVPTTRSLNLEREARCTQNEFCF